MNDTETTDVPKVVMDDMAGTKLWSRILALTNVAPEPLQRSDTARRISNLIDLMFVEDDAKEILMQALAGYAFNYLMEIGKHALRNASNPEFQVNQILTKHSRIPDRDRRSITKLTIEASRKRELHRNEKSRASGSTRIPEGPCYLCGDDIAETAESVQDHVWPRRAAGTNRHGNVRNTHASCEAPKLGLATVADVAILAYARAERPREFTTHDSSWPSTIETKQQLSTHHEVFKARSWRLAILASQAYLCADCSRPFSGGVVLRRSEDELPWAATNTRAVCPACESAYGAINISEAGYGDEEKATGIEEESCTEAHEDWTESEEETPGDSVPWIPHKSEG